MKLRHVVILLIAIIVPIIWAIVLYQILDLAFDFETIILWLFETLATYYLIANIRIVILQHEMGLPIFPERRKKPNQSIWYRILDEIF